MSGEHLGDLAVSLVSLIVFFPALCLISGRSGLTRWSEILMVGLAGTIAGILGMIGSFYIVNFFLRMTCGDMLGVFSAITAAGISVLGGGLAAMRAGILVGEFLDRNA